MDYNFEKIHNLDPDANLLNLFESVFRIVLPNTSARSFIGLKGVSERVLSPEGWYIFPTDCQGVFALELSEAIELNDFSKSEGTGTFGTFIVKYYPALNEELLVHFSQTEQLIRASNFFDKTGTPCLDAEPELHSSLFSTGTIELVRRKNSIELCMTAPKPCMYENRFYAEDTCTFNLCHDRHIPAWGLVWNLFNRLVLGVCYYLKTEPIETTLFKPKKVNAEIEKWSLSLHFNVAEVTQNNAKGIDGVFLSHFKYLETVGEGSSINEFKDDFASKWINPFWWKVLEYPISEHGVEFVD